MSLYLQCCFGVGLGKAHQCPNPARWVTMNRGAEPTPTRLVWCEEHRHRKCDIGPGDVRLTAKLKAKIESYGQ